MREIKYEIQCGTISGICSAINYDIAFKKLLRKNKNPILVRLVRFREISEYKCFHRIKNCICKPREWGKWKYQNPLSILGEKEKKVKTYPSTIELWQKDNGKLYHQFAYKLMKKMRKLGRGTPLETTKYALGNRIVKKREIGILKGFGRIGEYIRVQIKGHKSIHSYWVGFWQPLNSLTPRK